MTEGKSRLNMQGSDAGTSLSDTSSVAAHSVAACTSMLALHSKERTVIVCTIDRFEPLGEVKGFKEMPSECSVPLERATKGMG